MSRRPRIMRWNSASDRLEPLHDLSEDDDAYLDDEATLPGIPDAEWSWRRTAIVVALGLALLAFWALDATRSP